MALKMELCQHIFKLYLIHWNYLHLLQLTEKIRLGIALIDIFYHNPVSLARAFATLDILSNGRAIGGLGIGL
jgi:alkanesulfonate monooxygenase SsuD/methylene tetrahydromethanopterin reductase-like flavin-dependent oxidoreductase (luciferase family)